MNQVKYNTKISSMYFTFLAIEDFALCLLSRLNSLMSLGKTDAEKVY